MNILTCSSNNNNTSGKIGFGILRRCFQIFFLKVDIVTLFNCHITILSGEMNKRKTKNTAAYLASIIEF